MKTEKFNYTATETMHYHCPCCAAEWQVNKLPYCPNCEVKIQYAATHQEGGECYVECDVKEATHRAVENEVNSELIWLKKKTTPQISEGEIRDAFHKYAGIERPDESEWLMDIESFAKAITQLMKGGEGDMK